LPRKVKQKYEDVAIGLHLPTIDEVSHITYANFSHILYFICFVWYYNKQILICKDYSANWQKQLMIGLLNNRTLISFEDLNDEFSNIDDAIEWRRQKFKILPTANVVYSDMESNKIMTQLAFTALGCLHTTKINKTEQKNNEINSNNKIPENAVFVNDFTILSTFKTRKPYEKYGAAAYFNGMKK